MSEKTIILPRVMKAAIEFNVSKDTLVEFLETKGFSPDEMQRDFKLSEEMYRVAQSEFQQDKAAKAKAQQVELVKSGGAVELKKKRDEEDLSFKKKETAKVTKPVEEEKKAEPAPVEEKPVTEKKETKEAPSELTKIQAPELETPVVLDKIDLEKIDSSTRPKKSAKKTTDKE